MEVLNAAFEAFHACACAVGDVEDEYDACNLDDVEETQ